MSKQPTPLQKIYTETVAPALMASRGYKNKHQVPKLEKIVINTGISSEADKNTIADTARDIGLIAGQKPSSTAPRRPSPTSS
jgi:large subunit ribosomal protein L5